MGSKDEEPPFCYIVHEKGFEKEAARLKAIAAVYGLTVVRFLWSSKEARKLRKVGSGANEPNSPPWLFLREETTKENPTWNGAEVYVVKHVCRCSKCGADGFDVGNLWMSHHRRWGVVSRTFMSFVLVAIGFVRLHDVGKEDQWAGRQIKSRKKNKKERKS